MSFNQFKNLLIGAILIALIGCDQQPSSSASKNNKQLQSSPPKVSHQKVDAALDSADEYLNRQDYSSAELILTRLIELMPAEARAYELYGKSLLTRALVPDTKASPDEVTELISLAYEQYNKAAELVQAHSGESQWAAALHQSAGEIAAKAKKPDEALRHFLKAGKLSPANPKHPLYASQFLILKGLLDDAQRELLRVLEIDPDLPYAHASLAAVALQKGDFTLAISRIEVARKIAPKDLGLRIQEAKIRRRAGQPTRGIELLVLLDEQIRIQTDVTAEIAECYFALSEPEKAVEAWEYRYSIEETFLAAKQVAEVWLRIGSYQNALQWIQQASLLDPNSSELDSLYVQLEQLNMDK